MSRYKLIENLINFHFWDWFHKVHATYSQIHRQKFSKNIVFRTFNKSINPSKSEEEIFHDSNLFLLEENKRKDTSKFIIILYSIKLSVSIQYNVNETGHVGQKH